MAQQSFFDICLDQKKAVELFTVHIFEWANQIGNQKVEGEPRRIVDYDGFKYEVGAVRLNWSVSNKQLLSDFKMWLENNRPENVAPLELRGSASSGEKLKYLSAHRLLKTMTAPKALALTDKILAETLYLSDDNWYDADKRAQKLIRNYAVPFFNWA